DIRRSLNRTAPLHKSVSSALVARLAGHSVHVQPVVEADLVSRFIAKSKAVASTVTTVPSLMQVPEAVTEYLATNSQKLEVVMAPDPLLDDIDWPASIKIERRQAGRQDLVSVTGVFAAIAETGTLVLLSGAHSPTTLNFLPDVHIVIVRRQQIVTHIEDVWRRIRSELEDMPRTVNLITGPSRTADIEQTIQLGAHGPRSLHVIVVDAE
ncbi:MAG: lactate utilization protein C, partial [Acidiferrobacterales bacterium]